MGVDSFGVGALDRQLIAGSWRGKPHAVYSKEAHMQLNHSLQYSLHMSTYIQSENEQVQTGSSPHGSF